MSIDNSESRESLAGEKLWNIGDPFKYPIPGDGEHWKALLEPLIEKDRIQCAAWREEANNLVVFAGLFSSVLSAFVVQTIQNLQEDPSNQITTLLTQIAQNMNGTQSNTTLAVPDLTNTFTPSRSSVRVNAVWLISLIFSLTTVLISIVALQWLREHQNYPLSATAKDKFALFYMRQEGIRKWHVPGIFATIPVFLLLAVTLFLVGLVDFVLGFTTGLSIPVVAVTCIPLVFIVATTCLPSLQIFYDSITATTDATSKPPSQCPYKSTQSWLLHRVATISSPVFLLHLVPMVLTCLVIGFLRRPIQTIREYHKVRPGLLFFFKRRWYRRLYVDLYYFWNTSSWMSLDTQWLMFRSLYVIPADTPGYSYWGDLHSIPRSMYDCTRGILDIQSALSMTNMMNMKEEDTLFKLYHGVKDLVNQLIEDADPYAHCVHDLIHNYRSDLPNAPIPLSGIFERVFTSPQKDLIKEETLFIFLHQVPQHLSAVVRNHTHELHARLINYPLVHIQHPHRRIVHSRLPDYLLHPGWERQLGPNPFITQQDSIQVQYAQTIRRIFDLIAYKQIPESVLQGPFFLDVVSFLSSSSSLQSEDETIRTTEHLTALIRGRLGERNQNMHSNMLFYATALYTKALSKMNGPHIYSSHLDAHEESMLDLMDTLRSYSKHTDNYTSDELSTLLRIPNLPPVGQTEGTWWDFMQR